MDRRARLGRERRAKTIGVCLMPFVTTHSAWPSGTWSAAFYTAPITWSLVGPLIGSSGPSWPDGSPTIPAASSVMLHVPVSFT